METWLSPDVSDKELNLPGYQLLRLDRNRHGGGILMYVADLLSCKVLVSGGQFNLEFLAISFTAQFLVSSFCICLFYVLLLQFQFLIISITLCCPYVLFHFLPFVNNIGDFNVNFLFSHVSNLMYSFSLSQVVPSYTHVKHNEETPL